ncbi:PREDICTED: ejaculatory bulb-specific protein 3-like [Nicrophorus vespilloides]|uniref:Ejaculatory bulb-specific protein 3-like n=1 Tax=Nicrophorus vespilloides TaxID=110193 RepID=A0ABM1MYK6_NICVS|nr:PREDICTED: ejaculatory bulb-specific protein 3-like [Nicrophorus vespilloides]
MFKAALVFAAFCALVIADDHYTTKHDNIDVNEFLSNKRLVKNAIKCLLDRGNCTPEINDLKKVIDDALKTDCSKCSEKQKANAKVVLRHLFENEPEAFKELEAKYDKDGIYRNKYREEAKKEGVNL